MFCFVFLLYFAVRSKPVRDFRPSLLFVNRSWNFQLDALYFNRAVRFFSSSQLVFIGWGMK